MLECTADIQDHREVAPGVFFLTLQAPTLVERARPGQFVMLQVRSGLDPLLRRPFSICGRLQPDAFGVLYKVVGRGTALLSERRPGERVQVLGPLGNGFAVDDMIRPHRLVAGGMGVAPLLFLAQTLLERGERDVVCLTGYASGREVLRAGSLGLPEAETRIATDNGSLGHAGPVTDLLESRLRAGEAPGTVCACGPAAMLGRVAELARAAEAPCQVSLEAAMACGMGVCLGCTVRGATGEGDPYLRVCTEGPVFSAEAVDWDRLGARVSGTS